MMYDEKYILKNFINQKDYLIKVLILSGVHGNELTPIYCTALLNDLFSCGKNNNLYEHVSHVHIMGAVNTNGIKQNTRDFPEIQDNNRDLNRAFSEEKSESYEDVIDKIKSAVEEADLIIDIHSSYDCSEFVLVTNDNKTKSTIDYLVENDIPYVLWNSETSTIKKYTNGYGNKLGLTIELNRLDTVDVESAKAGVDLVVSILKTITTGVIRSSKYKNDKYETYREIQTPKSGLFIKPANFKYSCILKKGDVIGHLLDIKTFQMIDIKYPFTEPGKIMFFSDRGYSPVNSIVCGVQIV